MAGTHLVSLQEYLSLAYEPDAEYTGLFGSYAVRAGASPPGAGRGEIHTSQGIQRFEDGVFRAGDIEVDVRNA